MTDREIDLTIEIHFTRLIFSAHQNALRDAVSIATSNNLIQTRWPAIQSTIVRSVDTIQRDI